MLKIKLPFGFKSINLDNLYVLYTGKIRVKANYELIVNNLGNVDGLVINKSRGGCVTISYVVTDYTVHNSNIKKINAVLRSIMMDRIDKKYTDWSSTSEYVSIIEDELCF
jgi:hypothetical protein